MYIFINTYSLYIYFLFTVYRCPPPSPFCWCLPRVWPLPLSGWGDAPPSASVLVLSLPRPPLTLVARAQGITWQNTCTAVTNCTPPCLPSPFTPHPHTLLPPFPSPSPCSSSLTPSPSSKHNRFLPGIWAPEPTLPFQPLMPTHPSSSRPNRCRGAIPRYSICVWICISFYYFPNHCWF